MKIYFTYEQCRGSFSDFELQKVFAEHKSHSSDFAGL
jgi:hypothetical protein